MKLPQKVVVSQKIENIEIFSNLETKNRYAILNENGQELYYAFEKTGFFTRQLFGVLRPLTVDVVDNKNIAQLILKRKFYFMFANYSVTDKDNNPIGAIKQRFGFMNTIFEIHDEYGNIIYKAIAKWNHPWTYNIFSDGVKVGQILKKWSGFGKEMFTDADTFMVDFQNINQDSKKQLILAAALAIDLRVFERK